MKTIREKVIEQIELQEEIQRLANINVVNCGSCGSTLFHKMFGIMEDIDIVCPYCNFTSEPSDFPDFLYRGIENNQEFDEPEPEPVNECYIDYLDSKNKFRPARKEFKTYDEAKKWMFETFDKPDIDFVKYF